MKRLLPFAVLAGIVPAPLSAQAFQCRVPQQVSVPMVRQDGPRRVPPVTGYTLALSWSPAYCRTRENKPRDARQCSGRSGRFGLIVHGLWPESGRSWPQWCASKHRATGRDIARNLCATPSAPLLARQWAKHGTCMTRRPATYFKITRILWNSLAFPDLDRLSRDPDLTAGKVREAFILANPDWKPGYIGIKRNEAGWLQELRLCYDKRFRPAPCNAYRYGPADDAPISIWRGL